MIATSLLVSISKTAQRNVGSQLSTTLRSFATIHVEHGRGEWKTYGDVNNYVPGKFQIKTFNKISPIGLARLSGDRYDIRTEQEDAHNAHAILLRSHKLKEEEVAHTVRAIARYVLRKRRLLVILLTRI